jgi:hypothetical protein
MVEGAEGVPVEDGGGFSSDRERWPEKASLHVELAKDYTRSKVLLDGKPVACTAIAIRCAGGEYTYVTLELVGTHLKESVIVKGTLEIDDVSAEEAP